VRPHGEQALRFYKSALWKKCRAAYVAKVHSLCERCGEVGKIVHHKKWINQDNINDPSVTLSHDNLELLCQQCHNLEHFFKYAGVNDQLKFDERGQLVER
jgi:5-methylcytosine-specific restriction enzyme A